MSLPSNLAQIENDLRNKNHRLYDEFWKTKRTDLIPSAVFSSEKEIWIEIGAGSGDFFTALAPLNPDIHFIPIERCRTRAKTLLKRSQRLGLENLTALRGNVIPALIHGIPDESLDRIYILYPCPFSKKSQRKNRWYLHPVMPHLVRTLKKGGLLIWTSDQEFYIEEAHFVCAQNDSLTSLSHGSLKPNVYNHLKQFPHGRTKFERDFLASGQTSYELVLIKTESV